MKLIYGDAHIYIFTIFSLLRNVTVGNLTYFQYSLIIFRLAYSRLLTMLALLLADFIAILFGPFYANF